jgi:L-alanine-DL-glutamate epimerase-like enolase superfamily enzyme
MSEGKSRRDFLTAAALAVPAQVLANLPESRQPSPLAKSMKVTRVEALLLQKPMPETLWASIIPHNGLKAIAQRLIIKVHTDAGVTGYGEGTGAGAQLFRQGLADLVIGQDPFMVGKVWETLFAITNSRELVKREWSAGNLLSAMGPIDAALYDIMCKSTGLPLYKFLGGYRDSIPVCVTFGYYREGKGITDLVEEVRGYINQGFNAFKIKVGGLGVEDDYNRVKAVREAVGPSVRLMIDASQAWDVETAILASNRMYDLNITWLEEPLQWYDDVEALKKLKLNTRIPLAGGEREITRWGARQLMETGAVDFLTFEADAHGGITEWRKIAGTASTEHVWMSPHHQPVLHSHLLASMPNGYIVECVANPLYDPFWFELYDRKPKIENSVLHLDDTPGLGLEYNQKKLEQYATKLI